MQLTAWKHDPELREIAEPDPGPGQVLVRIGGAGACHSDLHVIDDLDEGPWPLPFTLGHENAGWVHATGPGAAPIEIGQPVAVFGAWGCGRCSRCLVGMENYCDRAPIGAALPGLGRDGGMTEFLLVPDARYLVALDTLDPVAAAPITDAGLTPYHAIKRSLPLLRPGSSAVVIGVGGLGHLAVQILEALSPARIIVVDERQSALDHAETLGADHGVPAGDEAAATVRDLTGGTGADLVLDFVGSDSTIALAAGVVRTLGHVTVVGVAGGSYPFSFFTAPYEASFASTYWGSLPELTEVLALAEAGRVKAQIDRFTLDEAPAAYQALRAGELAGRAVIVP